MTIPTLQLPTTNLYMLLEKMVSACQDRFCMWHMYISYSFSNFVTHWFLMLIKIVVVESSP